MALAKERRETDFANVDVESVEWLKRKPVHYKKLVVPTRMRSIYWKYFGFPAGDDGRMLTKDKIVCILCKSQMIYNRNTSNLRMHLISKHKNVIPKIDATISITETPKAKKIKSFKNSLISRNIDGNIDMSNMGVMGVSSRKGGEAKDVQVVVSEEVSETDISNIAIIFPNNEELGVNEYNTLKETEENVNVPESTDVGDAIVNFILADLVSPSIVEGKGFYHLLVNLCGKKVSLPNEKKLITEIIPTVYNTCKEQLFSTITSNCLTNISLSIEEWTTVDNVQCLSIYMHYLQNGEPCLFTKLLTTICCTGSESVSYWEATLTKLFSEWSINPGAVTAILISFSIKELKTALKTSGFVLLPCFMHMIQELCVKHCFGHPKISPVVAKCRNLVKFIQEMRTSIEEDGDVETDDDDNNDHFLISDCPEMWLTTHYMLKNLIRRKNSISEFLNDLSVTPSNIHINSTEWQQISDLLMLLEPLKTIVTTLLDLKSPLISLVKPLIWQVNTSQFEIASDDSTVIQELKTVIKNLLNEAYSEESAADNLTQIATTLDPRFKAFIQQFDSYDSESSLTDLLTHLVQSEGSLSPNDSQSSEKSTPAKKSKCSSINALFGNFCTVKPTLTLQDKVKVEVSHYQNESNALLEECPLEWWQHMRNKCPNLSRLALKYHCVPAIIMWNSGNCNFDEYSSFYRKRGLLKSSIADSMLFLHSNKFIF